jgi:hypothetical protein
MPTPIITSPVNATTSVIIEVLNTALLFALYITIRAVKTVKTKARNKYNVKVIGCPPIL